MWRTIFDATMRPVVIVLVQVAADVFSRLAETAIFRRPHFLFLQAAMEPFDVAVALRMVIRRAAMRDAEPRQRLHEPRRGKLRSIVGGQNQITFTTSGRQALQHCLLHRVQCFFRSAAMRKIPAYAFSCAAVDHADQVRPIYCRSCPDLGHVGLPDLIWRVRFYASPLFLPSCPQAT